MGVSYASPAYYADRLCERGRAYLRSYFAPTQGERDWFDKEKNKLEQHARENRPRPTPRTRGAQRKKTQAEKDTEKAEREAEKKDRDTALDAMKILVRARIDSVWNQAAVNAECAAQRVQLLKTMYWM